MHDRGVMSAFAAAYQQAELREGVLCCEMTDDMIHPWFVEVRDRIALSTYEGGYDIRRWSKFQSAAFVGMVSLSWSSAKETIGEVTHCAYPALKDMIELATTIDNGGQRDGVWEDVRGAVEAVDDIVHAWQDSKEQTAQAYPKPTKEAAVMCPHSSSPPPVPCPLHCRLPPTFPRVPRNCHLLPRPCPAHHGDLPLSVLAGLFASRSPAGPAAERWRRRPPLADRID